MITAARMRKLALALPEAEERSHFEQPDFRVRGKIFAGLSRDGTRGNLKLTPEIQSTVLGDTFTPAAGAWGRSGWTMVDLGTADENVLIELLEEAWRLVAPKALLGASPERETQPPAKRKTAAAKKKTAAAKKRPRRR